MDLVEDISSISDVYVGPEGCDQEEVADVIAIAWEANRSGGVDRLVK